MNVSRNSTILPITTKDTAEEIDFPQYFIFLFVQFLLLGIEFYLLAAFSYHLKRQRNSANQQSSQRGVNGKKKILIVLVMFVIITAVIRSALSLFTLLLPFNSLASDIILYCNIYLCIFHVLYVAGIASLYLFLWYRQHTLYALPTMKKIVPRLVKLFSDFTLLLILIYAAASTVGVIVITVFDGVIYIPRTHACAYSEPDESYMYAVNIVAYVVLVLFQGLLLFCFVYILRRHQADMKEHQAKSRRNNRPEQSLQKLIRICVIAATICIATDISTLIVAFFLSRSAHMYALIDVDYAINLFCAVVCFTNWKEMIDPWSLRKKIKSFFFRKNLINNAQISTLSNPIAIGE